MADDSAGGAAAGLDDISFDFSNLDITTEDINFDQIDDDLDRFQQDDIVKAALDRGVDLRNYSRQIEKDLHSVEIASIKDYVHESDSIAQLFQQVTTCETILTTMQDMLQGFRSNLGGISEEIKTLQNDSLTMNIKLRNRRTVAGKVTLFLEKVAVSEDMIDVICDGEINGTFVEYLRSLSAKLNYTSGLTASGGRRPGGASSSSVGSAAPVAASFPSSASAGAGSGSGSGAGAGSALNGSGEAESKSDPSGAALGYPGPVDGEPEEEIDLGVSPAETLAGRDALPELDRLRLKAVTRVREFLLVRIAELRQPKTNVQKLQEYVLLKYQYLMQFLMDHSRQLAAEVQQAYVDSMGSMLKNMFKTYHGCLSKLELQIANKNDLIAVEQNAVRSLFSSRVDLTKRTDAFCLGNRAKVLEAADAPPIHIHVAQAEKQKLPFEALFRSLQKHLMDAASAEFSFTSRFFASDTTDVFLRVFAKSISQVLENLEDYLCQSYDAVGLLLMIHITHQHRRVMAAKRVSCLDSYFNRVNMLLWPRFKTVFDLNLQSIRVANPRKLGSIELHPHYVTRRYSEFAASVLTLHRSLQSEDMSDDMVLHNLSVLRSDFLRLLQRMAEFHRTRKDRTVFLINNIDQCISVFRERHLPPADTEFFEELLARQVSVYVEDELAQHFAPLITFVKKTEAEALAMGVTGRGGGAGAGGVSSPDSTGSAGSGAGGGAGGGGDSKLPKGVIPRVDPSVATTLVRDFSGVWRDAVARINSSVMTNFADFRNGMEVLKQCLTQLLLYYTRFQEIIKRAAPDLERSMPRIADIFGEIRKHSRSFE